MRKAYTFRLDEEETETVRRWLAWNGQHNMSAWLRIIIGEYAKEIQGQPSILSKDPREMTLKEFGDVLSYWYRAVAEKEEAE